MVPPVVGSKVSDDAMRPHLAAAREKSLKQTLEYGASVSELVS